MAFNSFFNSLPFGGNFDNGMPVFPMGGAYGPVNAPKPPQTSTASQTQSAGYAQGGDGGVPGTVGAPAPYTNLVNAGLAGATAAENFQPNQNAFANTVNNIATIPNMAPADLYSNPGATQFGAQMGGVGSSQNNFGSSYSGPSQADYGGYNLPDPSQFAQSSTNNNINTVPTSRVPSFFNNPRAYLGNMWDNATATPDSFSLGNAVQLGLSAAGAAVPVIPGLLSGALGYLGVGTNDTGNSVLNHFAQPAFGIGTNNASQPYVPADSGAYTNPGATNLANDPSFGFNNAGNSNFDAGWNNGLDWGYGSNTGATGLYNELFGGSGGNTGVNGSIIYRPNE